MNERLRYSEIIEEFQPEISARIWMEYKINLDSEKRILVVLDDDPTGTQTVHGVPVLTNWTIEDLTSEFIKDTPVFYILTNSRALSEHDAIELNRDLANNLKKAAYSTGKEFRIVSRSDSTLRGHYPAETNQLKESLDLGDAIEIIAPAFFEGGRYTFNDSHFVKEKEWLIPAGETPFAKDPVFGYHHSNMIDWVIEKYGGSIQDRSIHSVSIMDIRTGGEGAVTKKLMDAVPGSIIILNALCYTDLILVAKCILIAEKRDKRFIYRSAASLVAALAGIKQKSLLEKKDLGLKSSKGIIVIGSYVPKTSAQLKKMQACNPEFCYIELKLGDIRKGLTGQQKKISEDIDIAIQSGKTSVLYTSRQQETFDDGEQRLIFGSCVSEALVSIIKALKTMPEYILTKGGITSSDIAVKALNIKRALILGQIIPGVPVWRSGEEAKWPGIPLIVFPGNVGNDDALNDVVNKLK